MRAHHLFGLSAALFSLSCSSSGDSGGTGAAAGSGAQGTGSAGGSGGSAGSSSGGTSGAGGDVCNLPQVVGPCEGALPRWWFDASSGKCEVFIYGGCEGNGNNFETPEACVAACAPSATNACDAVACGSISTCVFLQGAPACKVPCGEGCAANSPCGCAASCPTCKDCVQVCGGD